MVAQVVATRRHGLELDRDVAGAAERRDHLGQLVPRGQAVAEEEHPERRPLASATTEPHEEGGDGGCGAESDRGAHGTRLLAPVSALEDGEYNPPRRGA